MPQCINQNCNKYYSCGCQMFEGRYCSQKCKDEYLNKQNDSSKFEVLPKLQQSEGASPPDRQETIPGH